MDGSGPWGLFFERYPAAFAILGCMGWEPCFRERVWGRRGVPRVVMSFVTHVTKDVSERPVVWVHRCLREQEDVWFVEVKNSD